MIKKPIITSSQLLLLAVGSALFFPYTFLPILSAPPANQDVWIVLFMAMVYIFVLSIPLLFLIIKFRGVNANEMVESILGKILGKAAAVIFVLFFIYCFAACMLMTALYISLYIFPETPMWALILYILVPASYAAYKGVGTLGRLAFFIVPFMLLTIVVFFLLGLKDINLSELMPVLSDSTFLQLNQGAFLTGARYSEILIFWVFSFYLKRKSSISKTYTGAIGVFAIAFFLILLPVLTELGSELAKHAWNPYFIYSRHVKAYDFLERVQAINTLSWFPSALLKLALYNYMGSFVLSNALRTKSHKKYVIPISLTGAVACLVPVMNKSSTLEYLRSDQIFPFVVIPVTFMIPVILLAVYLFRRKKINEFLDKKKASELES